MGFLQQLVFIQIVKEEQKKLLAIDNYMANDNLGIPFFLIIFSCIHMYCIKQVILSASWLKDSEGQKFFTIDQSLLHFHETLEHPLLWLSKQLLICKKTKFILNYIIPSNIIQQQISNPIPTPITSTCPQMRTIHSKSQTNLNPTLDRTHSQRTFYINQQLSNSKDVATIFHSPFKDGKRNTNYTNPTFVSSNLFYPEQQVRRELTPKHNLIYNKNQRSRKELYDKRMQKADHLTSAVHQAAALDISNRERNRKVNDESQPHMARSRSRIRQEKNEQLVKELEILLKYREIDEKRQRSSRIYTELSRENLEPSTPVYIQKNRLQNQQKAQTQNKKNLQQWIGISQKIKTLKDTACQEGRKTETRAMDSFIAENAQRRYQKEMESRRNAGMLANILREQIKQANVRKERERREKYSYN